MPKFKKGDKVTFINSNGVKFPERTIVGLDDFKYEYDNEPRYFFEPNSAPWASVRESLFIHDADDIVVCEAGGHKIRYVSMDVDELVEQWFLVGITGESFKILDAAKEFAEKHPAEGFVNFTLPGVWEEVESGLYVKTFNDGNAFIEAQTDGKTVRFKAKAPGVLGGVMRAVQQVGETEEADQSKPEEIERVIAIMENRLGVSLLATTI